MMSWVITIGSGTMQDSNGICNLAGDRSEKRKCSSTSPP